MTSRRGATERDARPERAGRNRRTNLRQSPPGRRPLLLDAIFGATRISRVLAPNLRGERLLFSRQGLLDAFHYLGNGVTVRGIGLAMIDGAQTVKTASADFSPLPIRKARL
jgi:hypothetical protein